LHFKTKILHCWNLSSSEAIVEEAEKYEKEEEQRQQEAYKRNRKVYKFLDQTGTESY